MESSDRKGPFTLETPPLGSTRAVSRIGAVGIGAALLAVLIGQAAGPNDFLVSVRVILCVLGMFISGCALSMRPQWFASWLLAALTCLCAGFGFPASWDTFRFAAFVFSVVATAGALLAILPLFWRMTVAGLLVMLHFTGIFSAVTMPPPTPLITNQIWMVLFRPYLQFAYLNNAYQFYSPEPGPASELWFCIEYEPLPGDPYRLGEDGKPEQDYEGQPIFKKKTTWYKIPRRSSDYKDPLGQAYFRKLSLTEQVAFGSALSEFPLKVQEEITKRRQLRPNIPLSPADPSQLQYRAPSELMQTVIIPSYVRHVARQFQRDDRRIVGIKLYRVTHNIIRPDVYRSPVADGQHSHLDPYEPTSYLPYYMGDFNTEGELRYLNDPMLYWLVPIYRRSPNANDYINATKKIRSLEDYHRLYIDYVTIHADSDHREGESER